ncbi:MAG: Kelch repeat-containing protein [Gemmatimonadales bacterium]
MTPASSRFVSALSLFALVSCGENTSPNPPNTAENDPALASSFAATSNSWSLRATGPALLGTFAGTVPNSAGQWIVYVLGGTNDEGLNQVGPSFYNVSTNVWTSNGTPKVEVFSSNGVGRIRGLLYYSGGLAHVGTGSPEGDRRTFAYNSATNQLIQKKSMPKVTAEGVTGVINDKLYVLPGYCDGTYWPDTHYCDHSDFRRLLRYNPATDSWTNLNLAPHQHRRGAAGVIGGKFYVVGGIGSADLDVYDPATVSWKTLAPMPTAGTAIGAVLGAELFVVSEEVGGALHAYEYNHNTNTWRMRAAPQWRHDTMLRVLVNGQARLIAVGGVHTGSTGQVGNPAELYTP